MKNQNPQSYHVCWYIKGVGKFFKQMCAFQSKVDLEFLEGFEEPTYINNCYFRLWYA